MLSIVVDNPNSMSVREMTLPVPAEGEVRVRYAGICGSDLHIYRGRNPFVSYPRIIGHKSAASTVVYDAACHPAILEEAVRLTAPAGGIGVLDFSSTPSAIAQQELTNKELTLYASRLNCAMFLKVTDWISHSLVHPEHIVTHKVDFRDVASAFELTESNLKESCKVLLVFGANN